MSNRSHSTVVIYHSGYGHTQRMAEAVAEGAGGVLYAINAEGNISDEGWAALDAADAIIFGSPTYMGGPSWQFKKFADTSSKAWFTSKWQDKVFGGFTNSASLTAISSTRSNTSFSWRDSTEAFGSVWG
jgi:NAD(P)H dehydrogenase (quinone)